LRNQIEEKKKFEIRNKQEDEKFNQIIKSNVKKFVDEKEYQIKTYQSKVIGYKELLDNQLQEKGSKKYQMDEKERLLNKDLIGKVYSEYLE
jgi:undecaprenyl pyrophosphate synthase